GVEHHRQPGVGGLVHPADHFALVVGLPDLDAQAELAAGRAAQLGQVLERGRAVDLRFPDAEAAEVRTVEDEHPRNHWDTSWYACCRSSSEGSSRIPGRARPSSTTNLSRAPRAFLSTPMAARSDGHTPAGYAVGSPTLASTVRCIAARSASSRPVSRASSATYTMPMATASPCLNRYPSTRSMAWPSVCP